MRVGITGTRHTPTVRQRKWAHKMLRDGFGQVRRSANEDVITEIHHGACTGADELMHNLALHMDLWIYVHPPIKQDWLYMPAVTPLAGQKVVVRPPKAYHLRNADIVTETSVLIALPNSYEPVPHSGTWMTIGIAAAHHKPTWIGFPDGTYRFESNQG